MSDVQDLVNGFSGIVVYVEHLGICLLCLNDRGAQCKERERLLCECAQGLKIMNKRGISKEITNALGTLAGLQFKKEIQTSMLKKFDLLEYNPLEPEPA